MKSSKIEIKLEKQIESVAKTRKNALGFISWGERNIYPYQLSSLYYSSPTHKACIDFAVSSIIGGGIDYEKMGVNQEEIFPNYSETWDNVLRKCALDYSIYGSFAIQIIMNRDKKTFSFYHVEFSSIRCGSMDEDGVIPKYFICSDWTQVGRYKPIEIAAFGLTDKLEYGKPYLYVHKTYSPDSLYYPVPSYISAIKAIQTEIENLRFDLRATTNNFSATGILELNRCDTDEEKQELLQNITSMFSGSDNANSLIVTFKNDNDDSPIKFTSIDQNINKVDLFNENNKRSIERIISAHRIGSKQLIGYTSSNASLGGTGNEVRVAYQIYNSTKGNQDRLEIVDTFNRLMRLSGIEINLVLKPLELFVDETNNSVPAGNSQTDTSQDTSENNVEEKVTDNNGNN